MADAVVIGAGQNGLVAANVLADAGWDVLVLEEQDAPGGAVKSGELTGQPGFVHDLFSAFYPLTVVSPAMRAMRLEEHGLVWRRSPLAFAHPAIDGTCPYVSLDLEETVERLNHYENGDGEAWRRLYGIWERVGDPIMEAGFGAPFPPLRGAAKMAWALNRDTVRFLRMITLSVRRFGEEWFVSEQARRMITGNALHADLTPETAVSAGFGWMLSVLGQHVGFPTPEGGAGQIIAALLKRLDARGGVVRCGQRVEAVIVRGGRAVGVRTADGTEIDAPRAVIADVVAPKLFLDLVGEEHLPNRTVADLRRFEYDASTFKVDWALDGPIPWAAPDARRSGVIHTGEDMDHFTVHASELARKLMPSHPLMVVGQYAPVDSTRAPEGCDVAWAYTHHPRTPKGDAGGQDITGRFDERETELFARRLEDEIEARAPGFRDLIRARHVFTPHDLERANSNLVNGAINGGTAQAHQQLVFRPTSGVGRPETPIRNLYLGSSSAHPGGAVHGACGANAARAALRWRGLLPGVSTLPPR
ncbi:MAG TPA: NAD(P)/FAD-dependent oxidoreductase [Thermoleophilaceae bacterium]|jgi:phytoene dehydrogenase-like protein